MTSLQPRPDQIEDLAWHITNKRGLLRHEPGVGKTPIACWMARYVWDESQKRTIWPQPKSLLAKNKDEMMRFAEFSSSEVEIMLVDVLKATETERHGLAAGKAYKKFSWYEQTHPQWSKIRSALVETGSYDVIANSEAKVILCGFRFHTRFWQRMTENVGLILVDEAHKAYGNVDSQATTALYNHLSYVERFVPMTATLINGALSTAFPIIHMIEPRYYGSFNGFLDQHAGWIDSYGKVQQWINPQKLRQIISNHSTYRRFRDVYGAEAVVFFTEWVDITPEVREKYDEFHAFAVLELEQMLLDGSQPGVAALRARQLLAHPDSFGIIKSGVLTGKDEHLEIHADEPGTLAVFSAHVPEQKRIAGLLAKWGRKVGVINGDTSAVERGRIDLAFRNGELDAIVGTPVCMDVGFNWGHLDHVIFSSLDFLDTTFIQAYRRGLRGVRTKPLRVTTMLYRDSIDEQTAKIVTKKSVDANQVDEDRRILLFE